MEVLVFATSVQSMKEVEEFAPMLDSLAGKGNWNFALDDCDKILRIVSGTLKPKTAIDLLEHLGYHCSELGDEIIKEKILT